MCGRLWHTAAGLDPLDVSGIMSTPSQDNKNIFRFHQTSHGKKTLLNSVRTITKIARGSACNLYKLFDDHVEFAVLWLAFCSYNNTSSPFERELVYVYEVCVWWGDAYTEARGRHQVTTSIPRSSEVRFITGLEGGVF